MPPVTRMGPYPIPLNVTIIDHDTASVLLDESRGHLWWRQEIHHERRVFAIDGEWFYRRTGNPVLGNVRARLHAAWRVYNRERTEEARAQRNGHFGPR